MSDPNGADRPGEVRYELMLDAAELARHPELLAWAMGPLEAAMKLAPFHVTLTISRVEDEPSGE